MIEDGNILEKYNAIWVKVGADIYIKKLIAVLSITKNFLKPK